MKVRSRRAVECLLPILLIISIFGVMFPAGVSASQEEAGKLYQIGNDLFEKGKFREAAQKYEEAIKIVNDFAPLYYNLAEAQTELKEYERAIKNYREYLRLRPAGETAKKAQASINKLEGALGKTAPPSVSQTPHLRTKKCGASISATHNFTSRDSNTRTGMARSSCRARIRLGSGWVFRYGEPR